MLIKMAKIKFIKNPMYNDYMKYLILILIILMVGSELKANKELSSGISNIDETKFAPFADFSVSHTSSKNKRWYSQQNYK